MCAVVTAPLRGDCARVRLKAAATERAFLSSKNNANIIARAAKTGESVHASGEGKYDDDVCAVNTCPDTPVSQSKVDMTHMKGFGAAPALSPRLCACVCSCAKSAKHAPGYGRVLRVETARALLHEYVFVSSSQNVTVRPDQGDVYLRPRNALQLTQRKELSLVADVAATLAQTDDLYHARVTNTVSSVAIEIEVMDTMRDKGYFPETESNDSSSNNVGNGAELIASCTVKGRQSRKFGFDPSPPTSLRQAVCTPGAAMIMDRGVQYGLGHRLNNPARRGGRRISPSHADLARRLREGHGKLYDDEGDIPEEDEDGIDGNGAEGGIELLSLSLSGDGDVTATVSVTSSGVSYSSSVTASGTINETSSTPITVHSDDSCSVNPSCSRSSESRCCSRSKGSKTRSPDKQSQKRDRAQHRKQHAWPAFGSPPPHSELNINDNAVDTEDLDSSHGDSLDNAVNDNARTSPQPLGNVKSTSARSSNRATQRGYSGPYAPPQGREVAPKHFFGPALDLSTLRSKGARSVAGGSVATSRSVSLERNKSDPINNSLKIKSNADSELATTARVVSPFCTLQSPLSAFHSRALRGTISDTSTTTAATVEADHGESTSTHDGERTGSQSGQHKNGYKSSRGTYDRSISVAGDTSVAGSVTGAGHYESASSIDNGPGGSNYKGSRTESICQGTASRITASSKSVRPLRSALAATWTVARVNDGCMDMLTVAPASAALTPACLPFHIHSLPHTANVDRAVIGEASQQTPLLQCATLQQRPLLAASLRRGEPWVMEDTFLARPTLGPTQPDEAVLVICDGHGEWGRAVAEVAGMELVAHAAVEVAIPTFMGSPAHSVSAIKSARLQSPDPIKQSLSSKHLSTSQPFKRPPHLRKVTAKSVGAKKAFFPTTQSATHIREATMSMLPLDVHRESPIAETAIAVVPPITVIASAPAQEHTAHSAMNAANTAATAIAAATAAVASSYNVVVASAHAAAAARIATIAAAAAEAGNETPLTVVDLGSDFAGDSNTGLQSEMLPSALTDRKSFRHYAALQQRSLPPALAQSDGDSVHSCDRDISSGDEEDADAQDNGNSSSVSDSALGVAVVEPSPTSVVTTHDLRVRAEQSRLNVNLDSCNNDDGANSTEEEADISGHVLPRSASWEFTGYETAPLWHKLSTPPPMLFQQPAPTAGHIPVAVVTVHRLRDVPTVPTACAALQDAWIPAPRVHENNAVALNTTTSPATFSGDQDLGFATQLEENNSGECDSGPATATLASSASVRESSLPKSNDSKDGCVARTTQSLTVQPASLQSDRTEQSTAGGSSSAGQIRGKTRSDTGTRPIIAAPRYTSVTEESAVTRNSATESDGTASSDVAFTRARSQSSSLTKSTFAPPQLFVAKSNGGDSKSSRSRSAIESALNTTVGTQHQSWLTIHPAQSPARASLTVPRSPSLTTMESALSASSVPNPTIGALTVTETGAQESLGLWGQVQADLESCGRSAVIKACKATPYYGAPTALAILANKLPLNTTIASRRKHTSQQPAASTAGLSPVVSGAVDYAQSDTSRLTSATELGGHTVIVPVHESPALLADRWAADAAMHAVLTGAFAQAQARCIGVLSKSEYNYHYPAVVARAPDGTTVAGKLSQRATTDTKTVVKGGAAALVVRVSGRLRRVWAASTGDCKAILFHMPQIISKFANGGYGASSNIKVATAPSIVPGVTHDDLALEPSLVSNSAKTAAHARLQASPRGPPPAQTPRVVTTPSARGGNAAFSFAARPPLSPAHVSPRFRGSATGAAQPVACTATTCCLTACTGLSPACVTVRATVTATPLTLEHHPQRADEAARLLATQVPVLPVRGRLRVAGELALTRSLGDLTLKPAVSATPELARAGFTVGDVLVAASDGLWTVVTVAEVEAALAKATVACRHRDDAMTVGERNDAVCTNCSNSNSSELLSSPPPPPQDAAEMQAGLSGSAHERFWTSHHGGTNATEVRAAAAPAAESSSTSSAHHAVPHVDTDAIDNARCRSALSSQCPCILEAARALSQLALDRGSRDNVTVAVMDLTPYIAAAWASAAAASERAATKVNITSSSSSSSKAAMKQGSRGQSATDTADNL